jgi:hypothetical protein
MLHKPAALVTRPLHLLPKATTVAPTSDQAAANVAAAVVALQM